MSVARAALHAVLISLLVAFLAWWGGRSVYANPYGYDESDYMHAAGRGFLANYTDSPSLSLAAFIRAGMESRSAAAHPDGSRESLSDRIRSSGDMNFYRHAHGALFSYWLWMLSPWQHEEAWMRALSLVFPAAGIIAVYLCALWALPGAAGSLAAVLASVFYAGGTAVLQTVELAPHQMFVTWVLVSLLAAARAMRAPQDRRGWYIAWGFAALAFVTLEVAFVLIVTLIGCMFWAGVPDARRLGLRLAALFAGLVVVLHPPTLLALHVVKSYLFMAYLAVSRTNAWGEVTFGETWLRRFTGAPLEWLLVLAALPVWWRSRHTNASRAATPFLVFGGLMLALMARINAASPRYSLPFLPALALFAAFTWAGVFARMRWPRGHACAGVVCALQLLHTSHYLASRPPRTDFGPVAAMAAIRAHHLEDKTLLVPSDLLPTLRYYFPKAAIRSYRDETSLPNLLPQTNPDALIRRDQTVRLLR